MIECSWMGLGLFSATAATVLAAGTALFLGLYPQAVERRERRQHAAFLRAQLLSHLEGVQASLGPRDQPLASEQRGAFARVHFLGLHADLLRPEEWRGLIELQAMLQRIEHKTSINKREVRVLDRALMHTCAVLKAHGESDRSQVMIRRGALHGHRSNPKHNAHASGVGRFMRKKLYVRWGDQT